MNKQEIYLHRIRSLDDTLKRLFPNYTDINSIPFGIRLSLLKIGVFELTSRFEKVNLSYGGMVYDCYLSTKSNGYWIGTDDISLIILSDNVGLLRELNKRKNYNLGEEEGGWCGMQYAMLQIAASDWKGLENTIEYLKSVQPPYATLFHDVDIYFNLYEGFLKKDKQKVEDALNALEKEEYRKVRQKHLTIEKDISVITLALGRLAWMHGLEVKIDSEYVPKELLPFEPLEEYTIPYKFLRDFYRDQGVDWRYDPVYPELQDWDNDPENPNRKNGGFFKKLFG